MKTITYKQLKAAGACKSQLRLFRKLFGAKTEVTEELCVKHAHEFDFTWAAVKLLTATALEEYDRVTAPAWEEHERVTAPAWEEYERVRATAFWRLYQGM